MSYIQARTSSSINAFAFSFTPSQNPEYGLPDTPMDIIVYASPNTRNFLPVTRLTEDMPTSISESYTSPVIFTDGDSRFMRFQVMQTIGNRADSHIFAMSEFQLHEAVIDEAESPYYLNPNVKVAFDALQAELQTMRMRIGAGTASANDCETLRQAIEAAEQALENATGIKAVRDSGFSILNQKADIYDLQGRRIVNGRWLLNNGQLPKGVYIVNGKKVLF